jgi:hypothetical protein
MDRRMPIVPAILAFSSISQSDFATSQNGLVACDKRSGTMLLHLPTCLCESRPGRVFVGNAEKGWSMEKWLCWGSLGVAGILLLLFLLDMIFGIPFGGISWIVNIIGVFACGLTAYLAWESFKELR